MAKNWWEADPEDNKWWDADPADETPVTQQGFSAVDEPTIEDDLARGGLAALDAKAVSSVDAAPQRSAADYGKSLLEGATNFPASLVGLVDLFNTPHRAVYEKVTGDKAKTVTELLADIGVDFGRAKGILAESKSSRSKAEREEVNTAFSDGGVFEGVKALGDNPQVVAETVVQAVPEMMSLAGMVRTAAVSVFSKAVKTATVSGLGREAALEVGRAAVQKAAPKLALLSSTLEGAQSAGSASAEYAAEGRLKEREALAALASGVGVATIGAAANKLGAKIGLEDVETALASSGLRGGQPSSIAGKTGGAIAGAIKGGVKEGAEEAPQSALEQVSQNFANRRDLGEGVGQAAVEGFLAGSVLGAGGGGFAGTRTDNAADQVAKALAQDVESATWLPGSADQIARDQLSPENAQYTRAEAPSAAPIITPDTIAKTLAEAAGLPKVTPQQPERVKWKSPDGIDYPVTVVNPDIETDDGGRAALVNYNGVEMLVPQEQLDRPRTIDFTPEDSPTRAAGLPPIIIPERVNVSQPDAIGTGAAGSGLQQDIERAGGMAPSGPGFVGERPDTVTPGDVGSGGAPVPVGGAARQSFTGITLPRVDEKKVIPFGPATILPKVAAADKPLYHETNPMGLEDLLRDERDFTPANLFVTDNADLALGQGDNKGVKITFRPNALSGRENVKPGTAIPGVGKEFKVDASAPSAIQQITMSEKSYKGLRKLTRVSLNRDFDKVSLDGGSLQFTRKGTGEWQTFAPESGTLNVPRAEMPQVKAEHRGALANFLKARGIQGSEETVPASSLMPTQAEFSPAKVKQAMEYTGGNRAILVSADNRILDGHHQWLAAREKGEDVRVIRMGAPIQDIIQQAHEFPSSTKGETYDSGLPVNLAATRTPAVERLESGLNRWRSSAGLADPVKYEEISRNGLPDALGGAVAAFEGFTGANIAVVRNLTPETDSWNGLTFRDNTVFVDETAEAPVVTVAAHEFTHNLRRSDPALYQILEDEVRGQGLLSEWEAKLTRSARGEKVDSGMALEELTSNAVGDALSDKAFLQKLAKRNPSKFRQLADAFINFLNQFLGSAKDLGSNQYLRDVEKFRDVLADVLEQYTPQQGARQQQAPVQSTKQGTTDETRDRAGRDAGGEVAPLEGAPIIQGATGPDPRIVAVAERYAEDNGVSYTRQKEYVKVDEDRARRIAAAYDAMPHAPQDPAVKEAYTNLIEQTRAQYDALVDAGYQFYLHDETNDPYGGNPWNAMRDLRANQTMGVFATEAGFGSGATELNVDDNPLLAATGLMWPWGSVGGKPKRVLVNDLFRAVHDAFGHGLEGAGFRAEGEENAWQAHARLFTGSAVGAITTETRGQNSWLNYGPYGEKNRSAKVEDTVFADQKTGLMPEWTWSEGLAFSRKGDGRAFTGFFTNITQGFKGAPSGKAFEPVLDISAIAPFVNEYNKHRGNFDDHIGSSIPTFRELQTVVGDAIAKTFDDADMLDIGASEGALIKAITKLSDGKVRTVAVDPAPAMGQHFNKGEKVPGAVFKVAAFGSAEEAGTEAWVEGDTLTDRDGTKRANPFVGRSIPFYKPDRKFDIVHEAMVFQFVNSDRAEQVARIKELMKPDGVAILEEKFIPGEGLPKSQFDANEAQKDVFKEQYFSKEEIDAKAKAVGVKDQEAYAAAQAEKEEQVVGMADLMVAPATLERVLQDNFAHIVQFWDAGNFKGYMASDDRATIDKLLGNMEDVNSEFSNVETPRWIDPAFSLKQRVPDLTENGDAFYNQVFAVTDSGPFDGGCVYCAQAIQAVYGGDLVAFPRKGSQQADHAAVKLGNTYADAEGSTTLAKFISRFHDNEGVALGDPRPLTDDDLPEAPRGSVEEVDALAEIIREPAFSRKQTDTPAFKKWFGDSKVVDENGEPLVVYHGAPAGFTVFDIKKQGARDPGFYGKGFYFTPDKDDAFGYADSAAEADGTDVNSGAAIPVYVSLQNPFLWDMSPDATGRTREALSEVGINRSYVRGDSAALGNDDERRRFNSGVRRKGHDGVIVVDEDGFREVIAFSPEQIKSATGNIGTFDPENPDIRFSRKGFNPDRKDFNRRIKEDGGATYNADGSVFTAKKGYAVGLMSSDTEVGPGAYRAMMDFAAANADLLSYPSAKIGAFVFDDGRRMSIDLSMVTDDRDLAVRLGEQNNQDSVWDYAKSKLIKTGGDGAATMAPADVERALFEEGLRKVKVSENLLRSASLTNAIQVANGRKFSSILPLKETWQKAVQSELRKAKIDPDSRDFAARAYLHKAALADVREALRSNANAVGWYEHNLGDAKAVLTLTHPELATDPDAEFAFLYALAVTSNGMKVDKNFTLAEQAYETWKRSGRMPTDIGQGNAASVINAHLAAFDVMVENHGMAAFREFMTQDRTVREVNEFTGGRISGENLDTVVLGAAILGPKIGNGFFGNLYGRFDKLTMDRWFMRTWGRWNGNLVQVDKEKVAASRSRVKDAIANIGDKKGFEAIIGAKLTPGNPDAVAARVQTVAEKPDNRRAMALIEGGGELRKSGNQLAAALDGQKESPANGGERDFIRKVVTGALDTLRDSGFEELTMADLQALLWYAEKRLYDRAVSADDIADGYNDDDAPNYRNAAIALARQKGVPEDKIQSVLRYKDETGFSPGPAERDPVETPAFSRKVSPLGLYSALAEKVGERKNATARADEWKAIIRGLPGVKKDEIEWSGVTDWLDTQKGPIPRESVVAYLENDGVQVEEVVLGATQMTGEPEMIGVDDNGDAIYDEDDVLATKYAQYQLPGGANYREVLLTLPEKAPVRARSDYITAMKRKYGRDDWYKAASEGELLVFDTLRDDAIVERGRSSYMSTHWDQPNVLAHVRLNDRVDADGAKVLFVEEIQSDWSSQGRKEGFQLEDPAKATARRAAAKRAADELRAGRSLADMTTEEKIEWNRLTGESMESVAPNRGVPLAPFVTDTKSYVALAIKRITAIAANEGYDKVAFVNGEQSAERYDLSKQVSEVAYNKGAQFLRVLDTDGGEVFNGVKPQEELEAFLGKDVAEKIDAGGNFTQLRGLDLKVGGEGMKAFYDTIVPQVARDVLKRIGGKLETVEISDGRLEIREYNGNPVIYDKVTSKYYKGSTAALPWVDRIDGAKQYLSERTAGGDLAELNNVQEQPGFTITSEMRETVAAGLPMFSRKSVVGNQIQSAWSAPDPSKMDTFIYKIQDKQIDTKRVVEAINTQVGQIKDQWDPYLQETLYHGRAAEGVARFLDNELKPLFRDMIGRGETLESLEEFLTYAHAKEVNAYVRKVNPTFNGPGSGIDDADVTAYLATLPLDKRNRLYGLSRQVWDVVRTTQDLLVSSGLETQETIDKWRSVFPFYVPYERDNSDDFGLSGLIGAGTGQGFSIKGRTSKRLTGSKKPVINVVANIAMQRERAVTRAEKNRVALALYGLAVQNPNTDYWLPINPDAKLTAAGRRALQAELVSIGLNPLDARGIVEEPKQPYVDPQTGLVVQRVNPLLRNNPNVLSVKINGMDRHLIFNANSERAARMVEALKNLDTVQLGEVASRVAPITRYLASINTQYNPIFGVTNFTRDVQFAALSLSATPLAGKQAEVLSHVGPALSGIYEDLRYRRYGRHTLVSRAANAVFGAHTYSPAWAALWEDFRSTGGQTGYRAQFLTSEDRAKDITRVIKRLNANPASKGFHATFDWLSDYNEAIENSIRLSAYKVGLDNGMSKERAAELAKNLTVNFNRKGQIGQTAGAWYAFFNAAVQGTETLVRTLKGPAGKKIIAGGLLLGVAQAMALALAGFGEDEPPEFIKERNLVIPLFNEDKDYLTIPMPLGFHVIPNVSRKLTEGWLSDWNDTAGTVVDLITIFAESFNPLGSSGASLQTIAPSVADPLVALAENRDWGGKPIYQESFSNRDVSPGTDRARDTASIPSKYLAEFFNAASGGTDFVAGGFSPTPDQIDYLIGQATGGVGREGLKLGQLVETAFTGEELPSYKIPLGGRFFGSATGASSAAGTYYDNLARMTEHRAEIEGRRGAGQPVETYFKENPESRYAMEAMMSENAVRQLRRAKREAVAGGESKDRVKELEQKIQAEMTRFNLKVDGEKDYLARRKKLDKVSPQ